MSKVLHHQFLPIFGLFVLALWATWQHLIPGASSGLAVGWDDSLHFLSSASYACLLIGGLGLRRAYFLFRKKNNAPISIPLTILLAFFLPFLVCLIPIGVENLTDNPILYTLTELMLSLRIWLPALQVFSLGCIMFFGESFNLAKIKFLGTGLSWWTAGLAGLGTWLAGSYCFQLMNLLVPNAERQNFGMSPTRVWLSALLVLALPVLEGLFFRGRLLPQLQSKLGPIYGIFACAGISSFLSLQPILWIPAFLGGLIFNFLADQGEGLHSSIYAHAVFNVLALMVIPGLIL